MTNDSISVLLVDDHTVVRNGVRLMLGTASDIEVTGEAETAQEALDLIQRQDFNVALVDIALPDRSGLDLLKLMRAKKPDLPVLMLSMYSEEIYAVRALKHGAAGYLTKNSPTGTLVGAIRKAVAGGKYISPALAEQFACNVGGSPATSHEALSDRELEVLKLLVSGDSLAAIAKTLHLSPNTVTTYRSRICQKLQLKSNAELTRYALEQGLLL
ncbi:two component LuxR family transcriptional regulator [Caballeronia choica]|jgi:DNA-binding NarL/FixJ family response regulator|uniref:Two component LuxR family transcriptional regulator n=1 Tax=Caballeronia choica TaxID=326476 RepID=A0A158J2J0_9BURK|nr:response regulator transcription factor [Caballeronia choica]SAL63076.1 two component LuxR family transcriptional regulator [Caballeronia choica]